MVLALCCAFLAQAQERYGLLYSNYAGTDGVPMNPAHMADQWCWMDVNLIGADLFIRNDHVSVSSSSRTVLGEMRATIRSDQGTGFVFAESLREGGRRAFTNVRVVGPAIALSLGPECDRCIGQQPLQPQPYRDRPAAGTFCLQRPGLFTAMAYALS